MISCDKNHGFSVQKTMVVMECLCGIQIEI